MKKYNRAKNLPRNINGENNGHWKGGIFKRSDGYILVRKGVIKGNKKGARYKLQHRIIMEEYIKRPLLRSEIIHHLNGNPSDNRIENLKIMTQSEHAKQDYALRQINKLGQLIKYKTI